MNDHPQVRALMARTHYAQRTPEWYAIRRTLLTASDAASVLGIKPYPTYKGCPRSESLKRKLDNVPLNNMFVAHGTHYEDEARNLVADVLGETVYDCGLVVHQDLPWLAASPDGVTRTGKLIEIKCPLKREIVPGHIPSHYYPQVQVQMEVCDIDVTLFVQYKPSCVTRGPPQLDIVAIERDRLWFENVCDALHAFYVEYMAMAAVHKPPPPPRCMIRDDLYNDL
jgi:putative phage-type endonuclease